MKKSFKSGLVVFIIITAACLAMVIWGLTSRVKTSIRIKDAIFSSNSGIEIIDSSKNDSKKISKGKDYIAKVSLIGTIEEANATYNQQWLLKTINTLAEDEHNKAILLFINSPGGSVYYCDEIYFALQNYKAEGKKIYVYMGPMAASAAYYISCTANKIYANRNTLTGCIGVIMGQSIDLTGLFENLGIKSETIHSGKNKNMGNYNEPLTDEQREILQSISDEAYEQFTSIVATQRHLSLAKVKSLSDGRLYTANQALQNNLIDNIDTLDNCIEDLKEKELKNSELSVINFEYQRKQSFMNLMMGGVEKITNSQAAAKLGLPVKVMEQINNPIQYPAYIYQN